MEWKCFYCEKVSESAGDKCDCEKSKIKQSYITTNAVKTENGYVCECGCKEFTNIAHMDYTKFYTNTYCCSKCNNNIGIQIERVNDLYWDIEY